LATHALKNKNKSSRFGTTPCQNLVLFYLFCNVSAKTLCLYVLFSFSCLSVVLLGPTGRPGPSTQHKKQNNKQKNTKNKNNALATHALEQKTQGVGKGLLDAP
jgi:hypothetical protein